MSVFCFQPVIDAYRNKDLFAVGPDWHGNDTSVGFHIYDNVGEIKVFLDVLSNLRFQCYINMQHLLDSNPIINP